MQPRLPRPRVPFMPPGFWRIVNIASIASCVFFVLWCSSLAMGNAQHHDSTALLINCVAITLNFYNGWRNYSYWRPRCAYWWHERRYIIRQIEQTAREFERGYRLKEDWERFNDRKP